MSAIYELVAGVELKPGDSIRARPTDEPDGIVGDQVGDVYRLRPDLKVFRRIPATEDPRVLRRALVNCADEMGWDSTCSQGIIDSWIKEAAEELESEARQ